MRFNEQYVDSRVLEIDHHFGQYGRSRLIAAYHKYVLKESVKLGEVRPGMCVLDYGCGRQMLRHALPRDVKYFGYDLVPEFSDIDDIRGRPYDVIFAIQVLQYPDEAGLNELSEAFAQSSSRVVVMLPSSRAVKKYILDAILGLKKDADASFRSEPGLVYKTLDRVFQHEASKNLIGVGELSRWRRR